MLNRVFPRIVFIPRFPIFILDYIELPRFHWTLSSRLIYCFSNSTGDRLWVVAMSPDRVIKHLDIIEHITPCLLAVGIDPSAYPLPLEQLEETLSHSIVLVMAVATSALAG